MGWVKEFLQGVKDGHRAGLPRWVDWVISLAAVAAVVLVLVNK